MSAAFDASSLERSYAFLDDCPENLFDDIVTLPIGTLAERVSGARRWHDTLLAGSLPPNDDWPPAEIAAPVRLARWRFVHQAKRRPVAAAVARQDALFFRRWWEPDGYI